MESTTILTIAVAFILLAITAILLFFCAWLGYRNGLRIGMLAAKGQVPPKLDPVEAVKRAAGKNDPAVDDLTKHFQKMMAYNGKPAPKKKE